MASKLRVVLCAVALPGVLVGCGDDSVEPPAGVVVMDRSVGVDLWTSVTDPQTGREFRCLVIYRTRHSNDGGPAMFCYELGPK